MAKSKRAEREVPAVSESKAGSQAGGALISLVVVAGGVLMGFEIIGSRMLAPFFGNSVFVWGSLIGVFLASLSLGYWAGGILADKRPSFPLLSGLALAAALLIFASGPLTRPVCRAIVDAGVGDQAGPLLSAMLIFFLPSVLLGMVSPFAIRLSARSLGDIGVHAGRLYALSTLGSIGGTLGTTFVLIPALKVGTILMILGGLLAVVPLFVLVATRKHVAPLGAGLVLLVLGGGMAHASNPSSVRPGETLVEEASSPYHHVTIVDARGQRFMKFDEFYESGISLSPPYPSVFPYTELFHLGPVLTPAPKRVLFLGAGGGIGPRSFAAEYPTVERIDVVDVDPLVLDLATRHFHLEPTEKIHLYAEDARLFLRRAKEPYDLVVLDCFTIGGRIPFHLATVEFFEEVEEKLAPGGALVMNINSALEGRKAGIYASLAGTIAAAFGDVAAWPLLHGPERPEGRKYLETSRNVILAAVKGGLPPGETLVARAAESPVSAVRRAASTRIGDVKKAEPFTDEHAPIETFPF